MKVSCQITLLTKIGIREVVDGLLSCLHLLQMPHGIIRNSDHHEQTSKCVHDVAGTAVNISVYFILA